MRRDDPVHRHADSPYGPYWSVTRYADIMKVELDHATYSSASEMGGIQIADQPKGQELPNFIRMDPPRHTAQRKTVAPIVAPTNLANMEGLIRERTAAVLDGLPRNETFDWVDRVSTELTAHDAGDAVRLPVGRAAQAHLLVRRRHRQHRGRGRRGEERGRAHGRAHEDGARRMAALWKERAAAAAQVRPDLDDGARRGHAGTCRCASSSATSGC